MNLTTTTTKPEAAHRIDAVPPGRIADKAREGKPAERVTDERRRPGRAPERSFRPGAVRALALAGTATLALAGCASPDIDGEAWLDTAPDFALERFFDGEVRAWGIVQDRKGQLIQRFTVDIDGTWEDGVLTLDETFDYGVGDGVTERVWTIEQQADGRWSGGAGDILGEAEGQDFGNAFRWSYRMDLPVDDTSYEVAFDDWIWAFDEDTLVNRSWITKFGITFAEVTIFMQRQGGGEGDGG